MGLIRGCSRLLEDTIQKLNEITEKDLKNYKQE
jgi:hypothetical protein